MDRDNKIKEEIDRWTEIDGQRLMDRDRLIEITKYRDERREG